MSNNEDKPEHFTLPLFPLHMVLYPGMMLPLHIFEERYRTMISECYQEKKPFGVILIKEGKEVGGSAIPVSVGTTARIVDLQDAGGGRMNILARGVDRFEVRDIHQGTPHLVAEVACLADEISKAASEMTARVHSEYSAFLGRVTSLSGQAQGDYRAPEEPAALSYAIAAKLSASIRIPSSVRQDWLAAATVEQRLTMLSKVLVDANGALEEEILKRGTDDLLLN